MVVQQGLYGSSQSQFKISNSKKAKVRFWYFSTVYQWAIFESNRIPHNIRRIEPNVEPYFYYLTDCFADERIRLISDGMALPILSSIYCFVVYCI